MAGVIDLGRSETRHKRQYRVLRIPKTVVEKFLASKSGHPVKIEVPARPERRRKSDSWEQRASMNLAKAGLQNECKDKKVYRQIADRARLLAAFVPESEWAEITWNCDEEDDHEY
jgi:excinuclease UvrABC nuclease subunit